MLQPAPPQSNAERQRRFRAANPTYFRKYRLSARAARRDAEAAAYLAATLAAAAATGEAATAVTCEAAGAIERSSDQGD